MMSNISKAVADQLENVHKRQLSERYAVIFTDATYLNVRRDSVAKEPLHVLLGITPDGTRLRTLSNGDRGELRGDDGIHQKTRCEAGAAVCFGWVSRNA